MIPFFVPSVTPETVEAMTDALRNEKLVMGESVYKFEEEFARYVGTKRAVSVNSGNSALHLCLAALGVSAGGAVATSTNSFVASASCILAAGARPLLCDIHESDGNIDVSTCGGRPSALVPVHIYGNPCDWDAVSSYAEDEGIPVVEDACQAHGAEFGGRKCGSLGRAGCFSFYTTKNMTVMGDGGMVTTDDEELASAVASMRDNGRAAGDPTVHERLGYTMRLNTVNAAAGRVQLSGLDGANSRRRRIAELYRKKLGGGRLLRENPRGKSVFHQIVLKHAGRDRIRRHLKSKEIGTIVHYATPIHRQPVFAGSASLPRAESFCEQVLSLPSYPQLEDGQVSEVAEAVLEAVS